MAEGIVTITSGPAPGPTLAPGWFIAVCLAFGVGCTATTSEKEDSPRARPVMVASATFWRTTGGEGQEDDVATKCAGFMRAMRARAM